VIDSPASIPNSAKPGTVTTVVMTPVDGLPEVLVSVKRIDS